MADGDKKITELTALTIPDITDKIPIVDSSADETKYISMLNLFGNVYFPNASATDQGVTGNSDTIKYAVDTISTDSGTIVLRNNSGSATTTYTLSTNETIGTTIQLVIEKGALISIDTGKTLTIYSPANIKAASNQKIFTGAGAIAFTLGEEASIMWAGTTGDGTTNDYTAFQKMLTSVNGATGKSIMIVPSGYTFNIDGAVPLYAPPYCKITGGGTLKIATAATYDALIQDWSAQTAWDSDNNGIEIVGITIDGNEVLDIPMIEFKRAVDFKLIGNKLYDGFSGFRIVSTETVTYVDESTVDLASVGITKYCRRGVISNNKFYNMVYATAAYGWVVAINYAGSDIVVTDNEAWQCYRGYLAGPVSSNISITGNTFDSNGLVDSVYYQGIAVGQGGNNISVTGNTIKGPRNGITVESGFSVSIVGNTVIGVATNTDGVGIHVFSTSIAANIFNTENVVVSENTIKDYYTGIDATTSNPGATTGYLKNVIITDNIITNADNGIQINQATLGSSVISGNTIETNNGTASAYGIYILNGTNNVVKGNTINCATTGVLNIIGIKVNNETDVAILNNRIIGGSQQFYLDDSTGTFKGNIAEETNWIPVNSRPIYFSGTCLFNVDTMSVNIGTVAAGTDDEMALGRISAPNGASIQNCYITNSAALAADATNNTELSLLNEGDTGALLNRNFTSGGTYVLKIGDTITGDISGQTATVHLVLITGGTWAAGNASGVLFIDSPSGAFQSETLSVGANNDVATIGGDFTNTPSPTEVSTDTDTDNVSLTAFSAYAMRTVGGMSSNEAILQKGDTLTFDKADAGAGVAIDKMIVQVDYFSY